MKKQIIVFGMLVMFANANAQDGGDKKFELFFKNIFPKIQSREIKKEKIDDYTFGELKAKLESDTFSKKIIEKGKTRVEQFVLKPSERRLIDSIYSSASNSSWLYNNQTNESINSEKTYTLSKPIFLRNGSVCLFYYSYFCGPLCGQGNLSLYKKEKGKWVRWISLYDWVS